MREWDAEEVDWVEGEDLPVLLVVSEDFFNAGPHPGLQDRPALRVPSLDLGVPVMEHLETEDLQEESGNSSCL